MATASETKRTGFSRLLHRRERPKTSTAKNNTDPDPQASEAWFREKGGDFHPAFAVQTQWDDQEGSFKPEERLAIEYLEEVLVTHDVNTAPDEPKFGACSWVTVFEQLAQATEERSSQRDLSGATLLGIDLTTRYVELIPEEYGLGVIKGTLGLIFESTRRNIENKAKIMHAFETIPETILTINVACAYLDASETDLAVQRNFYSTVVLELPKLVELLLGKEKWYKKVASFFELRIRETMVIDDILARWNGYIRRLHEHVERMKTKVMAQGLHHSSEAHRHAEEANGKLDDANSKLDDANNKLDDTNMGMKSMDTKLDQVLVELGKLQTSERSAQAKEQWLRSKDTGAEAQTGVYNDVTVLIRQHDRDMEYYRHMLDAQQKDNNRLRQENSNLSHENEVLRATTPQPPGSECELEPEPEPLISLLELLGILRVTPESAWDDLDFVLREESKFGGRQLGRARWLLRTEEFLSWFQGRQSSILLVEGKLPQHSVQKVTPLSVFGSTFATSLMNSPSTIVLFFFGGLHCKEEEEEAETNGPNAMLRALITQLLLNDKMPQPALDFMGEDFLEACQAHDIRGLCELFEQLVLQIPPFTQVYCVLDGLGWYEQEPWSTDLGCVAAMFEHLSGQMDHDSFCFLKVLMLFPGLSLEVSDRIEGRPDVWTAASLAAGHTDPMHVSPLTELTELIYEEYDYNE